MGKLEGKVALVTGGNSGIGLATAKEFVGIVTTSGLDPRAWADAIGTPKSDGAQVEDFCPDRRTIL